MTGAFKDQESLGMINEVDDIEWLCAKTKFGHEVRKIQIILIVLPGLDLVYIFLVYFLLKVEQSDWLTFYLSLAPDVFSQYLQSIDNTCLHFHRIVLYPDSSAL